MLKEKIIKVLEPIFGVEVKKLIEDHYSSDEELIQLAYHMLSGYMGEENAKKILKNIIKKEVILKNE